MPKPQTPLLAADIIIELENQPEGSIILIERHNPPLGWAIPGGFVDIGESIEQAAVREAREETSLEVRLIALLGLYSDPSRDPRGHTVTAVYIASGQGIPKAADDAKNVMVITPKSVPTAVVFDHALVLMDYWHYKKTGAIAPIRHI